MKRLRKYITNKVLLDKRIILYFIIITIISLILNINWIIGYNDNLLMGIEEGFLALNIIKSFTLNSPLYWDSITYGQPYEVTPYGRISVNIFFILINTITKNWHLSYILTFVVLTFLSGILVYQTLKNFGTIKEISLLFSILYLLTNPLITYMYPQGHMRYIVLLFCTSAILYMWSVLIKNKKLSWYSYIFLMFLGLVSIYDHAVIFLLILFIILFLTPFFIHISKISKKYYFLFFVSLFFPIMLWLTNYLGYYKPYYYNILSKASIHLASANIISSIYSLHNMVNREPLEIYSLSNIYINLLRSFPFFASLLFVVYNRKKWLCWFIVFLIHLLGCGTNGPFFAFYNLYAEEIPFRAPARIFLSVSFPFIIILGGIGINELIKHIKVKQIYSIYSKVLFYITIIILLLSAFTVSNEVQFAYNLNPNLDDAYSKIPKYSRVLMLPVWGNVGSGVSLSYNGTYRYQPYPTVGYSVMHLHEYLSAKHNLKNAFSPPSPWETPSLTLWTFSDFLWYKLIKRGDFDRFYQFLKLLPNLQYIIVYKHILPKNIVNGLQNSMYIEKYYENDDLLILKVKNQTNSEIMVSDKAFVIYDASKWKDGYFSLLEITSWFNVTHPIIFDGITSWYKIELQKSHWDKTIILINSNDEKTLKEIMNSELIKMINNRKVVNSIISEKKKIVVTVVGCPKYILASDNLLEIKVNGKKYNIGRSKKIGDSYLYEVQIDSTKMINEISLLTNKQNKKYIWISNFNPVEISKIKTYFIDTPKGYRSDYELNVPLRQGYILLMKSYWPTFQCISDNKQVRNSYVANVMLNGFYFDNSEKIKIHFNPI